MFGWKNFKLVDIFFIRKFIRPKFFEIKVIYDKENYNSWIKDIIETTHIFFCKQYLGVNKRSPNAASKNELGRLPLKLLIVIF